MNVNIEELITLNYELEGLLHMVLHRGEDTPEKVWDLIAEKVHGLSEGIAEHNPVKEVEKSSITAEKENSPIVTVELPVIKEQEVISQHEVTIPRQEEIKPVPEQETAPITIIEPQQELQPAQSQPEPKPDIAPKEEKIQVKTELPVENDKPESKNEEPVIRLDEKLARKTYKDLRKAFSLNDRFRFRRELFGNNENDFADAINMIEAMSSAEEAHDYFYNDLKWDENSQEVQDFMAIVDHHFA